MPIFLLGLLIATAAPASDTHWVASWASAQQEVEPNNALPVEHRRDITLRQLVHLSIGGARVRVRLSNAFGRQPITIDAARVALGAPGSAATVPGSDRPLTFNGQAAITLPAGADYWSDPVTLPAAALSTVAVSLHLPTSAEPETGHPGARSTTFLVAGDHTVDQDLPGATTIQHWYALAAIEVSAPATGRTIATLGDSITDGRGATVDGDDRWPDDLARRLQSDPAGKNTAVVNVGIGGNRLLLDGLGPNALARFDRDVISQAGIRAVIVLEGVNDLGTLTRDQLASPEAHRALVQAMIGAYRQIIDRAHAHGIRAIGGTILPFGGSEYYHPDAANEADRTAINAWIRQHGNFDAMIDFDRAMRDPADPRRLRADYDSGDHLHPSPAGYRAMAAIIPTDELAR